MRAILGVASSILLAVSIASCGATADPGPAAPPSAAAPKPTTYFGETATAVAALIPGCADIKAGDVAKGGPDLTSTASCVLEGRTVDVNSWRDAKAIESMQAVLAANKAEVYYAEGTGWTAHVRRDMTFQYQITNEAGKLLAMTQEGAPSPSADIKGEEATAQKIADALGGKVRRMGT